MVGDNYQAGLMVNQYKRILVRREDGVKQHYKVSVKRLKKYRCVFGKFYIRKVKKIEKIKEKYTYYNANIVIYPTPLIFYNSMDYMNTVFKGHKTKGELDLRFLRSIGFRDFNDLKEWCRRNNRWYTYDVDYYTGYAYVVNGKLEIIKPSYKKF
jgi:hypothetical protein